MTFRERVEQKPLFFFLTAIVTGFLAGVGAYRSIIEIAQLETVSREELNRLRNTAARAVQQSASAVGEHLTDFDWNKNTVGWWQAQSDPQVKGCYRAEVTKERARSGSHSLAMSLDVDSADPSRRSGEAFIKVAHDRLDGKDNAVALKGRTLSAWIFAPATSLGAKQAPNGVQLFVKDSAYHSLYGPWTHLAANVWFPVHMTIGDEAEPGGYMDKGFSPFDVVLVGVKYGVGRDSKGGFKGRIFVDDVDW